MRFLGSFWCALLLGGCSAGAAVAADFPYSIDARTYYQGGMPTDGKFLKQNFLVSVKSLGIAPKSLNVFVDLSTGPGTPVLQQISCGMGEIQPGWTATYRGTSCNGPDVVTAPPGKPLYASISTESAPFHKTDDRRSTVRVTTEAVKPFPDSGATACAAPKIRGSYPQGGNSVSVNVYQLKGAVRADGKLDQGKICVVAMPVGADVVGLRLWGSLMAKDNRGKKSYVGSFICTVTDAPDKVAAGETVFCPVRGNNDVPDEMWMPVNAKLFVASTVTFGIPRSAPINPAPVLIYGTR